jgi:hypothetical protein
MHTDTHVCDEDKNSDKAVTNPAGLSLDCHRGSTKVIIPAFPGQTLTTQANKSWGPHMCLIGSFLRIAM